MLVLTLKPGQLVTMDGGITVRVLKIEEGNSPQNDRVRLGFDAPREIKILREGVERES